MYKNLIFFTIGALIFILIIVSFCIWKKLKLEELIPIIISTIAILFSLLTFFKTELFPPNLQIIAGNNYILNQDKPGNYNPSIILPITFINSGYGDCIVDVLALKIKHEDGVEVFYEPVSEIDIKALMQGAHKVHGSNIIDGYRSFNLFGRSSRIASFLFIQKDLDNPKNPKLIPIKMGKYICTFYVKKTIDDKLIPVETFKMEIDENIYKGIQDGTSGYHMNYKYEF